MIENQVELQQILAEHKRECLLPEDAALRFKSLVGDILHDYSVLAHKADLEGLFLWSMTPKWHWLYHLAERASYINPRMACCMVDEDYVGQLKVIVASCAQGTPSHKVPEKVSEKLRWAEHFEQLDTTSV